MLAADCSWKPWNSMPSTVRVTGALRNSFDGEFAAGHRRTELVVPSEANNFARLIQLFATAGFCVWRGGAAHDPGDSIKERRADDRDKRGIQADFAELARLRRLT